MPLCESRLHLPGTFVQDLGQECLHVTPLAVGLICPLNLYVVLHDGLI